MANDLQLRLKNSSIWQGKDRWKWSIWVEGGKESIEQIDRVEYVLHPTFPNPVRVVTDRASNFRLESKGWGEFMIHANVHIRSGRTLRLNHWLKLSSESVDETQIRQKEKPSVFLAYSRADYPLAIELSRFLERRGLEVLSENQLGPDEPIMSGVRSLIGRADAVLALIAREPSRWVLAEISEAEKQQIPVLPMLLGKETGMPESISTTPALRIENPQDAQEAQKAIERELSKLNL